MAPTTLILLELYSSPEDPVIEKVSPLRNSVFVYCPLSVIVFLSLSLERTVKLGS